VTRADPGGRRKPVVAPKKLSYTRHVAPPILIVAVLANILFIPTKLGK
jgi:hypothetical protein